MQALAPRNLSFGWMVTITSLAFVVAQLDVSIVNIALPQIAQTYRADISTLQWIIDAYTLAFAVLMLSAGSLSDLLGAKRIFQLGMLVFGIASIGCGMAWNASSLIGFRVLQGIGAATMIPSSLSILNHAFSHEPGTRARAVGLWTALGSSAIALGPVIGGLLIEISNWRFIFFVNAPLCAIGLLLSTRLPKSSPGKGKGFDFKGQVVWMLCITALIAAIIEYPHFGPRHPMIYGGLTFSALMLALFLRIERKVPHPMLPLYLFKSATFNVLLTLGAVLNGAYYGSVFILSLYLQNVLHYPTLTAGLAFLPLTVGFVISNLLSGRVINKYGLRIPILGGLSLFAAGFAGLLLVAKADTSYWQLLLPFIALPMGMGMAVPAMTTGTLASVDKSLSGIASASLNTVRQASGAIGVAVFGAVATGGSSSILHAVAFSAGISLACIALIWMLVYKWVSNTFS